MLDVRAAVKSNTAPVEADKEALQRCFCFCSFSRSALLMSSFSLSALKLKPTGGTRKCTNIQVRHHLNFEDFKTAVMRLEFIQLRRRDAAFRMEPNN